MRTDRHEKMGQTKVGSVSPRHTHGAATAHTIFDSEVWDAFVDCLHLSSRELDIAKMVFDDAKEERIAQQLGISPHTVHTHLERLYRKLNVNSRTQLVTRLIVCFLELTIDPAAPLPPLCPNRASGKCPLDNRQPNS